MIQIFWRLVVESGQAELTEATVEHVPRVGDLVEFANRKSYQVVDVLWHYDSADALRSVTVSAIALDWHRHIQRVQDEHRRKVSAAGI